MKLMIISPDSIIDKGTGTIFEDLENCLQAFLNLEDGNKIIALSSHKYKLKKIPEFIEKKKVSFTMKRGSKLISQIAKKENLPKSDIFILGTSDSDFYLASNNKTMLITAFYARNNNKNGHIFNYGIPLQYPSKLCGFADSFLSIKEPWYYKLEVTDNFCVYSLTNSNSFYKGKDLREINSSIKKFLKKGDSTYLDEIECYTTIATYKILADLKGVKYWGVYPSSDVMGNNEMNLLMVKLRQLFGCRESLPLFIRTKKVAKRHTKNKVVRINEGCSKQFDSIVINPRYKNKLKDSIVCVIDDFTTFGTSAETVRHLLREAQVQKGFFLTIGKYGNLYYKYDYKIEGDVFTKYKYKLLDQESLQGSQGKLIENPLPLSSRNMGKNDIWIAATTAVTKSTLLTTDKDFGHLHDTYFQVITVEY